MFSTSSKTRDKFYTLVALQLVQYSHVYTVTVFCVGFPCIHCSHIHHKRHRLQSPGSPLWVMKQT